MNNQRPQILLTNDDGIQSPGIWIAAEALSHLGYVTLVAPREQASGAGRSLPITSDGIIQETELQIGMQTWPVYSVGGTPAQAVQHALLEIMPCKPDLVVSGINYGENLGTDITVSGTVGAALESAAMGIPSMAVSLQVFDDEYYGYSRKVDFSISAYFTRLIASKILRAPLPADVHLLNVNIPAGATKETPIRVCRQSHQGYFIPVIVKEASWKEPGRISARAEYDLETVGEDTDIYRIVVDKVVSVTPLSLDMTARIDLLDFEEELKKD